MNTLSKALCSCVLSKRLTTNKVLQYCNESTESKTERVLGFINTLTVL